MGLVDDSRLKALLGAFLVSLFLLVALVGFGFVAAVSALAGPTPGAPLLVALLNAVAPYLVASALVGTLSFVLLVGLVVVGVRQASLPRDERLARVGRLVERHSSEAREVGLADRFEPTTEDRIDELKQRYVEGEITELEYERRLQDLMSEEGVSDERVRRERERTDYEFER